MRRQPILMAAGVLGWAAAVLVTPASLGAQGVTVALSPSQQVAPGAEFDLYLQVTKAGSPFNGFDAVIGYNPSALTLVPLSPVSQQEGSYMTGACGNTFHVFKPGASSDTITDVLLCNGVSLTGPGQIYRLHFRASTTAQVTVVRFLPGLQFYNAGIYVTPTTTTNAIIGIGMPPPVSVEDAGPPARLVLGAAPNPSPGGLVFTVESDRAGPETLTVFDVQGRVVRRFADRRSAAGVRTVAWDGRSDAGVRLAPGVYLARLESAGRAVWRRVTLVH